MVPVIPTLTVDGWDTTPISQMSKLWEYYQASDYSQSNTFRSKIISLKYTLQTETTPERLKDAIKNDINNLYGEFFEKVTPLIDVKDVGEGVVNINVDITCQRNFEEYKLTRAIRGRKSGIIEFETKLQEKYRYDIEY
jgi:hypothetical protein|nr:MAG TPA: hypothetical protein [Caudoviricetes sp.]